MIASLLDKPELAELFQAALTSNPFTEAAEACQPLAMLAYRCAELQGFRHPLCLDRKLRHNRCVARFFAPEFLERLETCEMRQPDEGCRVYEQDLLDVVSKRLNQHVDDIYFTREEKTAVARCGLPLEASTAFEYKERLQCMAPFVCETSLRQLEKCVDATGSPSGICQPRTEALIECLGSSTARMYFAQP